MMYIKVSTWKNGICDGFSIVAASIKIFIKIESLNNLKKLTDWVFNADLDELTASKNRGTKKKGPVFLQSQSIALTLEKDWAFQFLIK